MQQFAYGTFEGTGAAVNVEIGFAPDFVKCINVEDGDRVDEWIQGMADGTSIATVATAGPVLNADNGITPYSADDDAVGFTAGTDISESGKTIRWIAMAAR